MDQSRPNPAYEAAIKFYEADQRLDAETRKTLCNAFQREQWAIPLGAISLLSLGIMAPRWAARQGFINRPVSQTRILSAMLGLPGFMIGGRLGLSIVTSYNKSTVNESEPAQQVLAIMSQVPPQIGFAYYRNTARDSSYIMKDPRTIDWKSEPPFPVNLVRSNMGPRPGRPMQQPQQQQQPRQQQITDNSQARDSFSQDGEHTWSESYASYDDNGDSYGQSNNSNSGNSGSSSWDAIRSQYSQSSNASQSSSNSPSWSSSSSSSPTLGSFSSSGSSSSGFGTQPTDRPGTLTPTPPPPALSGPPQSTRVSTWESNDQAEFDRELERERQGYGTKDDFYDTERKW